LLGEPGKLGILITGHRLQVNWRRHRHPASRNF